VTRSFQQHLSLLVALKSPMSPACWTTRSTNRIRKSEGHEDTSVFGLNDPRKGRGEKRHGDVARRRDM